MDNERLRRILIRVIGVTMLVMAVTFIIYVVVGYAVGDPSIRCVVGAFVIGGFFIFAAVGRIWFTRWLFGAKGSVGFMQGYRRKRRDED